jgi:hypothetical protein
MKAIPEHLAAWKASVAEWRASPRVEQVRIAIVIEQLADERAGRAEAHRARLGSTARYLGREVAGHRVLLADAEKRLTAMVWALDPETPAPISLVPWREARALVAEAFAVGVQEARP